jgi:TfoX/Sxy family transcriptional regulator of competence genes
MAYSERLANRVREQLADLPFIEEKEMFGGLVFMFNEKMCVGIMKDGLMCRIDPALFEEMLEKQGVSPLAAPANAMKGFVVIDDTGIRTRKEFEYWIGLALDFNERAKKTVKKNRKSATK